MDKLDRALTIQKSNRARKIDRSRQHNRSGSEPRHGGKKGRKFIGNRGKVKPNSITGGCPYCQVRLINSRVKLLDVKLACKNFDL